MNITLSRRDIFVGNLSGVPKSQRGKLMNVIAVFLQDNALLSVACTSVPLCVPVNISCRDPDSTPCVFVGRWESAQTR